MPSTYKCSILGCPMTSRDPKGVIFHRFPSKYSILYEKWMSQCHESAEHLAATKHPLVCSRHFHRSDVCKKRLLPDSVPALFLTPEPGLIEQERARLAEVAKRPQIIKLLSDTVFEWVRRAKGHPDNAKTCTTWREMQRIAQRTQDLLGAHMHIVVSENWVRNFRRTHMELLDKEGPVPTQMSLDLRDIIKELDPEARILSEEEIAVIKQKKIELQNEKNLAKERNRQKIARRCQTNSPSCMEVKTQVGTSFKEADQIVKEELIIESDTHMEEVYIDSYSQALEQLKPLEDFALQQENYRLIGALSRLEALLKNPNRTSKS